MILTSSSEVNSGAGGVEGAVEGVGEGEVELEARAEAGADEDGVVDDDDMAPCR